MELKYYKSYLTLNKTNVIKLFFVFIFSCILSYNSFSLTNTFTGTGNFGTAARWSLAHAPLVTEDLVINGNCTVENNVLTSNILYGNLSLSASAVLSWASSGTNILNVVNVSASGASTLSMASCSGTLVIRGTWTSTSLTFTYGTGTIEIQNTITLPAAYTNYYNLKVNGSGKTVTLGASTTVNNNLDITLGTLTVGAFTFSVTGTATVAGTMNVNSTTGTKTFGNLTLSGTFNNSVNEPITINGNMTNNGTFTQGTGSVTFTGATSNTITGTAATTAFGGGIILNKGTSQSNVLDVQCVITMSSGGLTLNNGTFKLSSASTIIPFGTDITASPFLIPNTCGIWCNNASAVINSTAGQDWTTDGLVRCTLGTINIGVNTDDRFRTETGGIQLDGGTINIAGRITPTSALNAFFYTQSGGTLNVPTVGSTSTSKAPFDMSSTASTFVMTGGTIVIKKPGSGGGAANLFGFQCYASTYTVTGGTLQIGDGTTPAASKMQIESTVPLYNLTVNSTNATAQFYLTDNIVIKNDLTLTAGVLDPNNLNFSVGHDWTNNSSAATPYTISTYTNTCTFNGTAAQNITGSVSTSFGNIKINNSTSPQTSATVTLGRTTNVNGLLTLTDGYIVSSSTNILNMIAGSSTSGTSANSYVSGPMTKAGTTGFVFPVGSSDLTKWARIEIGAPSSSSTFSAQYFNTSYSNTSSIATTPTPKFDNVSIVEYWQLDRTVGTGNATVKLYWESAAYSGIDLCTNADLRVAHWNGSAWENNNDAVTVTSVGTCTVSTGTVATNAVVTSFSPFTFGSITTFTNPLPIQLLNFNANVCDKNVCLTWTTAMESNNDYFTVEKTKDGSSFDFVKNINGAGNNSTLLNYSTIDNDPFEGISYYRLKQTDYDGAFTYSSLRMVDFESSPQFSFNVFPNPSTGNNLNLIIDYKKEKEVLVVVYDITGREIYSKVIIIEKTGENVIAIDPSGKLSSGVYYIRATSAQGADSKKLIVN